MTDPALLDRLREIRKIAEFGADEFLDSAQRAKHKNILWLCDQVEALILERSENKPWPEDIDGDLAACESDGGYGEPDEIEEMRKQLDRSSNTILELNKKLEAALQREQQLQERNQALERTAERWAEQLTEAHQLLERCYKTILDRALGNFWVPLADDIRQFLGAS